MRKRPLLIASVGFTFGVLYGPAELPWVDLICGVLCIVTALRRKFRFPIMYWVLLSTGAFLLGPPIGSFLLPSQETLAPGAAEIEGEVVEAPDRGLYADGLVVDVDTPAEARLLLRVPHGAGEHPPSCGAVGDRIRATAEIS